jgi:hypothetical protein
MKSSLRWVGDVFFAASIIMVAALLHAWGAKEVREDANELVFLTIAGALWLLLARRLLFPCLGLSFHDDVVERRNRASLAASCGAVLALALIYAGGSIGEGPSYWSNVFSVALGTAGWLVLWILIEIGAKISLPIAEERDLASGLRLCGLLLANGLILGRAVAGDWHSEAATIHDLIRDGWAAPILCATALLVEKLAQPSRRHPFPAWTIDGLLPALLYLAFGMAWLSHLGAWEGMRK